MSTRRHPRHPSPTPGPAASRPHPDTRTHDTPTLIRLDDGHSPGVVRVLSERIQLAEGQDEVTFDIVRTGKWTGENGKVIADLDKAMFVRMHENFERGVIGQELVLNEAHDPDRGSAGFIRKLFLEGNGNKIRGRAELTRFGRESIAHRGMVYLSAEIHPNYLDKETGTRHGPTLVGAALTNHPVQRWQQPIARNAIQLSDDPKAPPLLLSERILTILDKERAQAMEKHLKLLAERLEQAKLDKAVITQLSDTMKKAGEGLTEEADIKALADQFIGLGEKLAKGESPGKVEITLAGPAPKGDAKTDPKADPKPVGLSEAQVTALWEKREQERDAKAKKLADDKAARLSEYHKALEANEGYMALDEGERKGLQKGQEALIEAATTPEQVTALAEQTIALGERLSAAGKLAAMGYEGPRGTTRISQDVGRGINRLQETLDKRLKLADRPKSANQAFIDEALAWFDRHNAPRLHMEDRALAEAIKLAAGDSGIADTAIPAVTERTVLREALYRLVSLGYMDVGTAEFALSIEIPYSYRDITAAGVGDVRVYERQAIQRAQMIQTVELAYPFPQKVGQSVSDELRYLSQAGRINWDHTAENIRNAARIINEDTEAINFNEHVNASDEFGAVAVTDEDLAPQMDGTDNVFPLANFPVVKPRSVFSLTGAQIGTTLNPITVVYESAPITEWAPGVSAGTYWVMDYNLGEIRLVDEAGDIQVPLVTDTCTISYSYATNVLNWDSDLPSGVPAKEHYNDLLYRIHLRKELIETGRFHMADLGFMSGNRHAALAQAEQFGANFLRPGTEVQANGNIGRVVDIPFSKPYAPGLQMGDHRIVIGEARVCRYRIMKPWSMGPVENQRDANGNFIGAKDNYGDQFIAVHTPTQLKRSMTTINVYSATARVDRVE